jgi:uncharacterized protein YcbK (DUF882 family)
MIGGVATAHAETRTLKLYFIHTKEKAEITYKRNGRYDQSGLSKVNRFLRDWRRNEPTKMDPRLLDLVWETYKSVGARDYIHVVSAYRSPATNSMLRGRSKGVAKKSQHMLGKAMDFYIPGVPLKRLREAGLKAQGGGVGYYPRSGSPFVHLDVGNVRHWPKMSRRELAAIFPNGKTLHVPSDGKPLPGFDQALAAYKSRQKNGTTALALASTGSSKPSKGLLAALFGGGADEEEESGGNFEDAAPVARKASPRAEPKPAPVATARAELKPDAPLPGIRVIPPSEANRVDLPMAEDAAPEPEVAETPESIIAALSPRSVPVPAFAPRAPLAPAAVAAIAEAAPVPPADVPFGMADEQALAAVETPQQEIPAAEAPVVALGVPLPTPRPQLAVPAPVTNLDAVLLALAADRGTSTSDAAFPMPMLRESPEEPRADAAAPVSGSGEADRKAQIDAVIRANEARVAALEEFNSERPTASISRAVSLPEAVDVDARTTRKGSKPTRAEARPQPKPVVVEAEPQAAQWVLNKDYVATVPRGTTAPSFAYNAVVTAPRVVYTAGFQKGEGAPDASRFSGKAVQFMSVARFQ